MERSQDQKTFPHQTVTIDLGERSYRILAGRSLLERTGELVRPVLGPEAQRVAIISNHPIFDLYGDLVVESLRAASFVVATSLMEDGERFKTLETAESLYRFLARERLDRQSCIIALGGGVVGDTAGFVAATFLRGIAYIQIPTTLLAAIDSSVGGKTGINLPEGKNLVGAFHQPRLVITDIAVLRSLPERELQAGFYEALKYGIITDPSLFERVVAAGTRSPNVPDAMWIELISRCCEIKAQVVAADERESGLRQILNLGHTFGHAAEAITGYETLKHGEAVGYGLVFATRLATRLGLISTVEAMKIEDGVQSLGVLPLLSSFPIDDWLAAMQRDKKVRRNQFTFILPVRVGEVRVVNDIPTQSVVETLQEFLPEIALT